MGEEQDCEGERKCQEASIDVLVSADKPQEEHHVHEEGEELVDNVEDAKHHEARQEARALE